MAEEKAKEEAEKLIKENESLREIADAVETAKEIKDFVEGKDNDEEEGEEEQEEDEGEDEDGKPKKKKKKSKLASMTAGAKKGLKMAKQAEDTTGIRLRP